MRKEKQFDNYSAAINIESYTENYSLCILLNEDGTRVYDFCWITLNRTENKDSWDNPFYIWNDLYDTLYHWLKDKEIIDKELFSDIVRDIPIQDFEEVFDLLEFGIKLGFKA